MSRETERRLARLEKRSGIATDYQSWLAGLTNEELEIAELTGKEHKHVLFDIRKMLAELGKRSADFSANVPDAYGRQREVYHLPKREWRDTFLGSGPDTLSPGTMAALMAEYGITAANSEVTE